MPNTFGAEVLCLFSLNFHYPFLANPPKLVNVILTSTTGKDQNSRIKAGIVNYEVIEGKTDIKCGVIFFQGERKS